MQRGRDGHEVVVTASVCVCFISILDGLAKLVRNVIEIVLTASNTTQGKPNLRATFSPTHPLELRIVRFPQNTVFIPKQIAM